MTTSTVTPTAIRHWLEYEKDTLANTQEHILREYQDRRERVVKQDLPRLDQAIQERYLHMASSKGKAGHVRTAYQLWCMAHGLPTLIIEPTAHEHVVQLEFDLESMSPYGDFNIYEPQLDTKDEIFQVMMLLADEYSYSSKHVTLRHVPAVNAGEVAHQLLAWFDRCAEARRREVEALSREGV